MSKFVDVVIREKVYSLKGEDAEHIQALSVFLNNKYDELSESDGFERLGKDYQNIMLQLNIADEYLRCAEENKRLKETIEDYEHQIYNLKHELITLQMKSVKGDE